jgi:hypothetical protein
MKGVLKMEKAEKNFIDFCAAAQKDNELWVKLSKITEPGTLKTFFSDLGFTVDNKHVLKILETKEEIKKNMNIKSDRDYY